MFAKMYLFLPLIFSNGVKRHVVDYDKLRFQPEIICNTVCEECFQQMYIFLPLIISNCVKRDVVVYDQRGFQPEIICIVILALVYIFQHLAYKAGSS